MQKHYPNLLGTQKDDLSSLETACLFQSDSIFAADRIIPLEFLKYQFY